MSLILFNDTTEQYNVQIFQHSVGTDYKRIKIEFEENIDISSLPFKNGFQNVNEHNNSLQGDYSEYKYIYYKNDEGNIVILTNNDEDIYVEITPDSNNVEPTTSSIVSYIPTLEELKEEKIKYFSSICNQSILNGVDIEIDNKIEHFSYSEEDQVNIKELFDLAIKTNIPLYYHADGESCKLYSVEQIVTIYSTMITNKMHHTTYFNQLKQYINSIENKENLADLTYGTELTGIYLDTYNNAMAQAGLLLQTLIKENE